MAERKPEVRESYLRTRKALLGALNPAVVTHFIPWGKKSTSDTQNTILPGAKLMLRTRRLFRRAKSRSPKKMSGTSSGRRHVGSARLANNLNLQRNICCIERQVLTKMLPVPVLGLYRKECSVPKKKNSIKFAVV